MGMHDSFSAFDDLLSHTISTSVMKTIAYADIWKVVQRTNV